MSNELKIEYRERAAIIYFTRPEIRNPLSVTVLEQLNDIIDNRLKGVETVIFTGSGNAFASGADLREIAGVAANEATDFALRGQSLMAKIETMARTSIAAINGYCFGGALDLALACQSRIASPDAKFAHPGAGLGIITGWGGTQRLPRLIGRANALEMFYTASPIDAARALQIGLVESISDKPTETALEYRR